MWLCGTASIKDFQKWHYCKGVALLRPPSSEVRSEKVQCKMAVFSTAEAPNAFCVRRHHEVCCFQFRFRGLITEEERKKAVELARMVDLHRYPQFEVGVSVNGGPFVGVRRIRIVF